MPLESLANPFGSFRMGLYPPGVSCNSTKYWNGSANVTESYVSSESYINSKNTGVGLGDSVARGSNATSSEGFLYDLEQYIATSDVDYGTFTNNGFGGQVIADIAPDGYGGEDTARNITNACLRQGADYVVIQVLTNDVIAGTSVATLKTTIDAIVTEAEKYKCDIIWGTVLPRPVAETTQIADALELSAYIEALTSTEINIFTYDANTALSLSGSAGTLDPALSADLIHPDNAPHHDVLWTQLLKPIMTAGGSNLVPATGWTQLFNDYLRTIFTGGAVEIITADTTIFEGEFIVGDLTAIGNSSIFEFGNGSSGMNIAYVAGNGIRFLYTGNAGSAVTSSYVAVSEGDHISFKISHNSTSVSIKINTLVQVKSNTVTSAIFDRVSVSSQDSTAGRFPAKWKFFNSSYTGRLNLDTRIWTETDPNGNKFFSTTESAVIREWTFGTGTPFNTMFPYGMIWDTSYLISDTSCGGNKLVINELTGIAVVNELTGKFVINEA